MLYKNYLQSSEALTWLVTHDLGGFTGPGSSTTSSVGASLFPMES